MISCIGNHEVDGGYKKKREQSPQYLSLFDGLFRETTYGVLDIGDYLSLVLLDTGHIAPIGGEQTDWLESALEERQERPHLIVANHVPAYPSHRSPEGKDGAFGTGEANRLHWCPLFENFKVDAVLEHHDHTFKRSHPLTDGQIDKNGVLYLGDGSWGKLRAPNKPEQRPYLATVGKAYHISVHRLEGPQRFHVALESSGRLADVVSTTGKRPAAAAERVPDRAACSSRRGRGSSRQLVTLSPVAPLRDPCSTQSWLPNLGPVPLKMFQSPQIQDISGTGSFFGPIGRLSILERNIHDSHPACRAGAAPAPIDSGSRPASAPGPAAGHLRQRRHSQRRDSLRIRRHRLRRHRAWQAHFHPRHRLDRLQPADRPVAPPFQPESYSNNPLSIGYRDNQYMETVDVFSDTLAKTAVFNSNSEKFGLPAPRPNWLLPAERRTDAQTSSAFRVPQAPMSMAACATLPGRLPKNCFTAAIHTACFG